MISEGSGWSIHNRLIFEEVLESVRDLGPVCKLLCNLHRCQDEYPSITEEQQMATLKAAKFVLRR